MKIFYSPGQHGFYNEIIHGARELTVIDPAFVMPTVMDTMEENGEMVVVEVPDPDAVIPYIKQPNPDCLVPSDVIEISGDLHSALMQAQTEGKVIMAGEDGIPFAAEQPPPSADQIRIQRDAKLAATDWTQLGDVPAATKTLWQNYRQALRDVPEQAEFPSAVQWPVAPA